MEEKLRRFGEYLEKERQKLENNLNIFDNYLKDLSREEEKYKAQTQGAYFELAQIIEQYNTEVK